MAVRRGPDNHQSEPTKPSLGSRRGILYPLLVATILTLAAAAPRQSPKLLPDLREWLLVSLRAPLADPGLSALDSRLAVPDTIETDTIEVDTLDLVNVPRSKRYFAPLGTDTYYTPVRPRHRTPFFPTLPGVWKHEISYDSLSGRYISTEYIGDTAVRIPTTVTMEAYRATRLSESVEGNWFSLVDQRAQQRARQRRGGLGFNIVVPGGRQSAFTTIFGKPEVDLRVNGQADIRAGFDYRKSEQQTTIGNSSQLDPQFKQDLRLGITGTIGDKMRIDVQYDTNNQFDFQNQIKLRYTGYEDEIIQSIEAGNVFLQTPSTLIRGGQSLFGIKSEFQIGGLHLTTVMSQQEGQSNNLNIESGSEATTFALKPTDYDDSKHYFLGYYFRNRWNDALSDPPQLIVANGFDGIQEIEVWKFENTNPEDDDVREVVAVVDLGEPTELLSQADAFTDTDASALPDNASTREQYTDGAGSDLEQLRDRDTPAGSFLRDRGLQDADFQTGPFRKLVEGKDYVVDKVLGYVSLTTRLQESEAIAVSYRYVANGQVKQVGDFSTDSGGADEDTRLILKLLRPGTPQQPNLESGFNPAYWYLELRNIYDIRGSNINSTGFSLDIFYEPSGTTAQPKIPALSSRKLIDLLGLDRLDEDGGIRSDDLFDFRPGFSINPSNGLIIFPYLEPFGDRIRDIVEEAPSSDTDLQELIDTYVFDDLYLQKKEFARRETQLDVYRIRGEYKGSVKDFYDLGSFAGIIPGSVRVTSAGAELTENVDFVVDYQGGTLTITNPSYLIEGRDLDISYEQNSFFNLQKKTLLGARADYDLDERLGLGATVMRLSEKSPSDKFRIGEEPISNVIWGVDGNLDVRPRWLTQMVDRIPLINTKAESRISVTGEFAQLRPGHTQTTAFDRSRRELQDDDRDFHPDELSGISYLDDFEGFENTFSLLTPGAWHLGAAPDSIGAVDPLDPDADSLITNWRGTLAWYSVSQSLLRELSPVVAYDPNAVRSVLIEEVFPDRETTGQADQTLTTLDYYFNPRERGPYNYTTDLEGFIANPMDTWGGMTQRLPEGFNDFGLKNIEFVEFIIRPFPENQANEAGPDAKLYLNLGSVSEDILPDERLNQEDGLSTSTISESSITTWGRIPTSLRDKVVQIDEDTRFTEDLGLDGLASYGGAYPEFATEASHFAEFLASFNDANTDPAYRAEVARARLDPSGDDYHYFSDESYFGNTELYPNGATLQQRFSRYFAGHELNAFEAQRELAENVSSDARIGNSKFPNSEDLNSNSTVDTRNSYFEYEIPLSRAILDQQAVPSEVDDFVVTEITSQDGERTGWYQIRIPVRDFTRKVGDIQDFSQIESIRMWTTGHSVPITVRFAALELVGSQWQKAEDLPLDEEVPGLTPESFDTRISISSVNNEENSSVYVPPTGTVISQTRLANGTTQNTREQAMVLRAENLQPGHQMAIFKPFSTGLDLLKYSNIRMFTHFHGTLGDGTQLETLPKEEGRSKAKIFVRLGANETNDYYEYEQPLTPSSETSGSSNDLWQTTQLFNGETIDLNSINIEISAFNQLKVERDQRGAPTDSVFWNVEGSEIRGPNAEEFAPPGTRLGIKGTPSLGRISTIVVGIRNPSGDTLMTPANILEDAVVWINELRVSGYDEKNGWAALANATIRLADLGSIKGNFQRSTDGFGSLSSTLDERDQQSRQSWSLTTDLNLDHPIPERFGWNIPISLQVQSSTSTPRFSPNRGDIRLDDIVAQIESRNDVDDQEKRDLINDATVSAETHSVSRSMSARVSKSGSQSRLVKNTIEGITASYSYSDTESRNPSQSFNDSWRWQNSLGYRLTIRNPKTVRPFWFLEGIPVLEKVGDMRFNYLPQSVNLSQSMSRNYSEARDRPQTLRPDTLSTIEVLANNPLRDTHSFRHSRDFALQYNPFKFLNFSLDTNTNQSLNDLGAALIPKVVDVEANQIYQNTDLESALAQGLIDSSDVDVTAFFQEDLHLEPSMKVIGRLLRGDERLRTERNSQRFNATVRPNFTNNKVLDWISIQDIVYSVQYNWQNSAVSTNNGAGLSNSVTIRTGITFRPQEFWRKFEFYRSLEEAETSYRRTKDAQRSKRKEDRRRAREQKEEQKKLEERLREQMADSTGSVNPDSIRINTGATIDAPPLFRLPSPNPVSMLRRVALALTGVRDFNVTYSGTRTGSSSNVGREDGSGETIQSPYSLWSSVFGDGPPLGYRFGFTRSIGSDQGRILRENLQVQDLLSDNDRFSARTTLTPSRSLSISLNWSTDLTASKTQTFRIEGGLIDTTITRSGQKRSSIWTFGTSYLQMFQNQYQTYQRDRALAPGLDGSGNVVIGDLDNDGRVILTNGSLVEDFRKAFSANLGTLDGDNLLPLPLPGWTINYTGFGKLPVIRSLVQSASLRHTYASEYTSDYRTNSLALASDSTQLSGFTLIPNREISFVIPDVEATSVRINRRYNPLVGLDLTWRGRFQTKLAWNKNATYSLSTSNSDISESKTGELTFSASYQKTGLKLPFSNGRKLNNRVTFNLSASRSKTLDLRYRLREALVQKAASIDGLIQFNDSQALSGDLVSEINSHTRFTLSPQIGYQFSDRVTANFSLKYENFIGDSRQPSSQNINGAFNIRLNIAN